MAKNSGPIIKFVLFALALIGVVYIFKFTDIGAGITPEAIKGFVEGFGILGPVIFIFIYAAGTIFLIPGTVLTFAGAILFGTAKGFLYNWIGAVIGATLCFMSAKYLGRDFVVSITRGKAKKLDTKIGEKGFMAVFIPRLIPVVPFNILNFGSGLTKISLKDYFLATALGIIPGTFIYTYLFATLGEKVLAGDFGFMDMMATEVLIPVLLFAALIIFSIAGKKYIEKRKYHPK